MGNRASCRAGWVGVLTVLLIAGCDRLKKSELEEPPKGATSKPSEPPPGRVFPGQGAEGRVTGESAPAGEQRTPQEIVAAFLAKDPRTRTNQDLEELAGLPEGREEITLLDLSASQVGDAGLAYLGKFPNVETLDVSGTRISNEGLKALPELPKLKVFVANGLRGVDELGLEPLGRCPGVREVSLQNTIVADGVFTSLAALPDLEVLRIGGASNLLGMGFSKGVENGAFQKLRELHAGNSQFVTYGVLQLGKLKQLEVLDLSHVDMNDGLIEGFDECVNLKRLVMARSKVSSAGLKSLAKLRKLEELNISACTAINDAGLQFLKPHKQLKRLDLDGTSCTTEGVRQLKKALPDTVIRFQGVEG